MNAPEIIKPDRTGYVRKTINGRRNRHHVIQAESALGKPLPSGAVVHHVDENKQNNANSNLVICQSTEYHSLLHRRMRALEACGHAGWRKCKICKQHDDPVNLTIIGRWSYHSACRSAYRRFSYAAAKNGAIA